MFLISVTIPVIPLMKHCLFAILRSCVSASMELSDDVVSSNNTSIIVASPLINAFLMSFGIISVGRLISATSSYQSTSCTCGTFSNSFSSFCTSFISMFSTATMENAPIPNSSTSISCPFTVSR